MSNSLTSALLAALNSLDEPASPDDSRSVVDQVKPAAPASQVPASSARAQVQAQVQATTIVGDQEERLVATIRMGMAKAKIPAV